MTSGVRASPLIVWTLPGTGTSIPSRMSSPLANRSGGTASGRTVTAALAPIRLGAVAPAIGPIARTQPRCDGIGPGQPFGQDQQGRPPAPQLEQPGDVLRPVLRASARRPADSSVSRSAGAADHAGLAEAPDQGRSGPYSRSRRPTAPAPPRRAPARSGCRRRAGAPGRRRRPARPRPGRRPAGR